jgi:hypothetical protein
VAVSARLEDIEDRIRVVFDDLVEVENEECVWQQWALFTHLDFPRNKMLAHELSEREYAAIGQAIILRLLAHRSVQKSAKKSR